MRGLPPFGELLKLRTERDANGAPLFVMPFHEDVVGRPGYLHGGAIAGLLEFAAYAALSEALDEGDVVLKPVTVTVDYMLGGEARDTFASGSVQRLGSRTANVEAYAWQSDRSRPIAAARMNFLLRPRAQ